MAGSAMTFTYDVEAKFCKIIVAWTSDDATGAVSGSTAKVCGYLLKGVTDPGAAAPTASYDIVLTDPEGTDLLGNCDDDLIDRHTSTTEVVDFAVATATGARPCVCDVITISITNAGNAKTGQIILYVDGYVPSGSEA